MISSNLITLAQALLDEVVHLDEPDTELMFARELGVGPYATETFIGSLDNMFDGQADLMCMEAFQVGVLAARLEQKVIDGDPQLLQDMQTLLMGVAMVDPDKYTQVMIDEMVDILLGQYGVHVEDGTEMSEIVDMLIQHIRAEDPQQADLMEKELAPLRVLGGGEPDESETTD